MEKDKIKGVTGTGMFTAGETTDNTLKNDIDELQELEAMPHLPDTDAAPVPSMVIHKAASRGHADHGWLDSWQSFSFADYYNPDRMHFGVLRVLNDDRVDPGKGFGRHPHDNMEIISIPLQGDLEHRDSMGNAAIIRNGDIQVMSAGTGIFHSEYNNSQEHPVYFLQIWLFPKKKNLAPRYGQVSLDTNERRNKLQQVVSPDPGGAGVWINQDAWFHMASFDNKFSTTYHLKDPANGVYAFVLKGNLTVAGNALSDRDGLGIWNVDKVTITANSADAEILLMEVPMLMS